MRPILRCQHWSDLLRSDGTFPTVKLRVSCGDATLAMGHGDRSGAKQCQSQPGAMCDYGYIGVLWKLTNTLRFQAKVAGT